MKILCAKRERGEPMKAKKRMPSYYGKNIAQNAQRKFLRRRWREGLEAGDTEHQNRGEEGDKKSGNR